MTVSRETHPERFARPAARGATRRVLLRLAASAGRVVTDEALIFAMYGDHADGGPDGPENVLAVLICKQRALLPAGAIRRVRGVGYIMDRDKVPGWLLAEVDDAHVVLARSPADARRFAEMRDR